MRNGHATRPLFTDSRGQPVLRLPDMVLPSTCVIITRTIDNQCEVLCHQRSDNGWWGFVGGAQCPGESIEQCARRETWEETGLVVTLHELVCVDSDPHDGAICLYPDGNIVQYTCLTFSASIAPGTETALRCSEESLALRWCRWDALPTPFLPLHQRRLHARMFAIPLRKVVAPA